MEDGRQNIIRQIFRAVALHVGDTNSFFAGRCGIDTVVAAAEYGDPFAVLQALYGRSGNLRVHLRDDRVREVPEFLQIAFVIVIGKFQLAVGVLLTQNGGFYVVILPFLIDKPEQRLH